MRTKIIPEMQRRVLAHLAAGPSTNTRMVAAGVGLKNSISRACIALEGYGEARRMLLPGALIEMIDRRMRWYELTPAGRERLAEINKKNIAPLP